MLKNFSTNQLSVISAVFIALCSAIVTQLQSNNLLYSGICLVAIFIISYFVVLEFLKRIIYQEIKLIYKLIYTTKANKREETFYKYLLPNRSIKETEEEVRIWAERRNRELENLRSMEVYRREFLQNLSHEIKTPIFAIQGYVDILLHDNGVTNDQRKRFLTNASRNVERMVLLMRDIDEISKLESGVYKLNQSRFVIQTLIKEVFESLSYKTAEKHITCAIKKNCEYPLSVFADEEKIRQVITNLVINALKYGKTNGNILAGIYKTDDHHILVEITDDGIGIAEAHLPRIFERFYRTDKGRSRDIGGTGLGLAICKHIIEAHAQSIHARSKVDVGTTIGFTLTSKS